ncbi:MAG: PD-(D/E)XK nuclease family protein [Clostridia bacterium]|nr:PD-(D/E)XK nuclease family protein [Clostridia bacterium]
MLHRIFCRESERRVERVFGLIEEKLKEEKRIFLIVPEQITVGFEARAAARFDAGSNFFLETINFSRLPNRVFRETGGLSFRQVTKTGRLLTLSRALSSLAGELKTLAPRADRPAAVERLLKQIDEFSDCGVTPDRLEELASICAEERPDTAMKLTELAMLFRRYRELIGLCWDDSVKENARLKDRLDRTHFFEDTYVFIEGFYDFTADQYQIIRRICDQAKEVWVGFFAEEKDLSGEGFGVRAAVAARKIASFGEYEDEFLPCGAASPALSHLSKALSGKEGRSDCDSEAVEVVKCEDAYDELRFAASSIRKLVMGGMKYSQIALTFRGSDVYSKLAPDLFESYDIPLHTAVIKSAAETPPARLIMSACDIAAGDRRPGTFSKYLRTGLSGLEKEEEFSLDAYARMWNLSGSAWLSDGDLVMPPEGYSVSADERDPALLDAVNAARRKMISPIKKLAASLGAAGTVREKLKALCELLTDTGAEAAIRKKTDALRETTDADSLEEADEICTQWNALLEALNQTELTLGDQKCTAKEFADDLRLALSGCESGTLPPAPDCVTVGEASFVRMSGVRALFVLGLNNALFPLEDRQPGVLSGAERNFFRENFIDLSLSPEESLQDEYFLFDQLVRTPTEKLFLTCHERMSSSQKSDDKPSVFILSALNAFEGKKLIKYDPESEVPVCDKEAFDFYCAHLGSDAPLEKFLEERFKGDKRLEAVNRARVFCDSAIDLKGPAQTDPQRLTMSQSKIKDYVECRYKYFLNHCLRLKRPASAFPDNSNDGTMTHEILEKFLQAIIDAGKDPDELDDGFLKAEADRLVEEYASERGLRQSPDAGKFDFLLFSSKKRLFAVMKSILNQLRVPGFRPVMLEAVIGRDTDACRIDLPDGSKMEVTGKIDRIDRFTDPDGKEYVRVIDYKTGSDNKFSLTDVFNGLGMQMLIYLFALSSGKIKLDGKRKDVLPAGVLYVPAKTSSPNRPSKDKSAEDMLLETLKPNGIVLDDPEVKKATASEEEGLFIETKDLKKMLTTLEEMSLLKNHTEKKLKELGDRIRKGKIAPDPFAYGHDSCEYCPFGAVCKFESEPTKKLLTFENDRDAVYAAMREEESENER